MQNFMKTILSAFQTWTKREIANVRKEIKNNSTDWNENDPNKNSYVKNRTHWIDEEGVVHKLDQKFLDIPENVATTDEVQEVLQVANDAHRLLNNKMDNANPTGTGSFSMNRLANSIIGRYSCTEGQDNVASGLAAHAGGSNTTAYGDNSFAIGTNNIINGKGSFAHGEYNKDYDKGIDVIKNTGGTAHIRKNESFYCSDKYVFNPNTSTYSLIEPFLVSDNFLNYKGNYFIYESGEMVPNATSGKNLLLITNNSTFGSHNSTFNKIVNFSLRQPTVDPTERFHYAYILGNGTSDTDRSNAHTIDWNGVGWYQGGLQVGGNSQDDGAKNVLLEGDAINFKELQITLPSDVNWSSIAHGNGKYIAIGSSTDTNNIFAYSDDGITWTPINIDFADYWQSVTYGNGKFVAISGIVTTKLSTAAYSEDGINWTKTSLGRAHYWQSVTYGNGKFVAVSGRYNGESGYAAYSEDGINWTSTTMPSSQAWHTVAYGNGKFVALTSSDNIAAYSEDGINWTQFTVCTSEGYNFIIYEKNKFVAVSDNTIIYSEDGINWEQAVLQKTYFLNSVAYGDGKFVAVSGDTSNYRESLSNIVIYSDDGISWHEATLPIDGVWISIVYGNNGFVAIDYLNEKVVYSKNGVDWCGISDITLIQGDKDITSNLRKLILDGHTIPTPSTAQPGQVLVVKTVDENGKPTEWEVTDAPTGSGGESGSGGDYPGDDYINNLINTALGVIENGTY